MGEGPKIANNLQERIDAINTCEFALLNGMEILEMDSSVPMARVAMSRDGKLNGFGTVHGGAIFSLADQAFGVAANLEGISQVAVSAYIKYIAPATGRLEAEAKKVGENDNISMYQVHVYEGTRLVALFQGTGYKLGQETVGG